MAATPSGAVWRKRMQDLSRHVGLPHEPLFAPLTLAVSAQIESIAVADMARDATRLRKNAAEMRRLLGLQALVCAVPSAMELEAAGATVSDDWPPRVMAAPPAGLGDIDPAALAASPRLRAALEATVQVAAADASEPVILAAFSGPATLLSQLRAAGAEADAEAGYDFVGRLLAACGRLFCESGVHVLALHEAHRPDAADLDAWKAALGTVGNVARFHRVPPLLVFGGSAQLPPWPAQAMPCPTLAQHSGSLPRAHGRAWSADVSSWPRLPGSTASERLVTTVTDLPADLSVAQVKACVEQARAG